MKKPRQKPLVGRDKKKKAKLGDEFSEDDSWVIVKKQKIRILVPPLPSTKQVTVSNSEPSQSQPMIIEPIPSGSLISNEETSFEKHAEQQPSIPSSSKTCLKIITSQETSFEKNIEQQPSIPSSSKETCLKINLNEQREKPVLLAPKLDIPTARRSPRPITTIQKLPGKANHVEMDSPKHHYMPTLHSRSRVRKPAFSFFSGHMILSPRMRASILEKKLQRAGGLSRWLASIGLDRFVKIFQRKRVGKFQLANLSMEKLKDMGANAVGPRRKLIHAVECMCEPSCFGAL